MYAPTRSAVRETRVTAFLLNDVDALRHVGFIQNLHEQELPNPFMFALHVMRCCSSEETWGLL